MITVAPNSGCSAISKISDDIKAHPNPLNRASAGFLKGAVELVSGLAEGGVNLTQVGLEELEVFGDMLQGNKPSQWKMADISGMLETEKQLARLALGTVTSNVFFDASIVLDGLPQRGNVGSIQKELRLDRQMSENFWQETSKSIAEAFKEDPAQATGCAVFEVGLLLFPWAKSGKLGETTKGAEMLNDVDKLSDGANLLQRLSKSTGFGDDLTAANQLKTFNQGLKGFSQAAKASLSKEALEDLGENLRNLTFQVPSQEFALESAGTTGKIKSVGEFLDNTKVNVQRFATSSSNDVAKVGELSVPKKLVGYDDYSKFSSKVAQSELSTEEKVKKLQEAFQNLENKTDINVPSDPQYLKGFTEWGTPNYDWPPKLGFQEETIQGITRELGLPETWDRYGYMGGGNFSDVPASGPYSYSERSIPYLENPDAYHTGTFNKSTYFDKIDAIKDGDLSKLNSILESEGIKSLSRREFRGLEKQYSEFITSTTKYLESSNLDISYGIHGKAAPWGNMSGGAEQIVTPFDGETMEDLGIMKEVR